MQAACVRFLVCPVCGAAIKAAGAALRCAAGHAFDLAREGYANLLVTRRRRSRMVGDTPAMVAARAAFLARGHYDRLADEVAKLVAGHLRARPAADAGCVVDVGCGTGHHLGRVRDRLRADGAELARLLAPDGLLLVVTPGPGHLAELARRVGLLGIQPEKQRAVDAGMGPWLRPLWARRLRYPMELTGPEAAELARMGPSARHLAPAALAEAERLERLTVTADFHLAGYAPR